jgi:transcriptional regulator with XRE-family HTH domain
LCKITQIASSDAVKVLDGSLCVAARGLLGWSQERLRLECGIARKTLSEFENGIRRPHSRIIGQIVDVLYAQGILLVATSRNEGLGVLKLEARASG